MLIVKGTFCSFTTCADKFKFSKLEFPVASSIEGDLYLDYESGLTYESQAMELNWNKELWWAKHAIRIVRASDQLIYHSDHAFNEARFLEAAESA
jgi:hypothetical protein